MNYNNEITNKEIEQLTSKINQEVFEELDVFCKTS